MENDTNNDTKKGSDRSEIRFNDLLGIKRGCNVPQCTLNLAKDGSVCGLDGWQEVVRWGDLNHVTWRAVRQACDFNRVEKVDELKLLSSQLLRRVVELEGQCMELAARNPLPPIICLNPGEVNIDAVE